MDRRDFFRATTLAAALPLGGPARAAATPARPPDGAALAWLEGASAFSAGTTFGVPWPRGAVPRGQDFVVDGASGEVPAQSWPLAYWPDSSLKWTAHALGAASRSDAGLRVRPGRPRARTRHAITMRRTAGGFVADTGVVECTVPGRGPVLVAAIRRAGRDIARNVRLVALCDDQPEGSTRRGEFADDVERMALEPDGPVRSVLKIEGRHRGADRAWLPFTVRLHLYAGAESVRIMHTLVFDGDEYKDFIRGIGLAFDVPLRDALHGRHVRFAGEDGGLWSEAVRNLTGLRRDPGADVRRAQLAGERRPPVADKVAPLPHLVPAWGDVSLSQLSADSFRIRKRTKAGCGWIDAAWGRRAPGCGYVDGVSGGVAFGLRDFWQRHPTQLDIRAAPTESARATVWMWSPDAPAMDLRFYHDGMGMDMHAEELQGLEITYEDYEKGFPSTKSRGPARTRWRNGASPPSRTWR